jgi:type IX secretion system PorP/SprF family membrane protein
MKQKLTLFVFVLLSAAAAAQYNPLQSQYMLNPLVLNPAYAGAQDFLSATMSYRRQWLGFDGAPETYAFTAHTPLRNRHLNLGFIVAQDNIAVLHRTQVEVAYAHRIRAGKFHLAAGFSPTISLLRNNWSEIQTNTSGDMSFQGTASELTYGSGFGIYGGYGPFFLGGSSRFVVTERGEFFYKNQPILVYTGCTLTKQKRVGVMVSALGRYMYGYDYQADFNVLVTLRERIGFGVSWRMNDAVVGILNVRLNEQFRLGYSYDYTLSRLRNYSTGSHELVLRYDFGFKVSTTSPRNL